MLIRILSFLVDSLFFVLIGAALMRAWMNRLRINMSAQPGTFVMAVTDWLGKPLRRGVPQALGQPRLGRGRGPTAPAGLCPASPSRPSQKCRAARSC